MIYELAIWLKVLLLAIIHKYSVGGVLVCRNTERGLVENTVSVGSGRFEPPTGGIVRAQVAMISNECSTYSPTSKPREPCL